MNPQIIIERKKQIFTHGLGWHWHSSFVGGLTRSPISLPSLSPQRHFSVSLSSGLSSTLMLVSVSFSVFFGFVFYYLVMLSFVFSSASGGGGVCCGDEMER